MAEKVTFATKRISQKYTVMCHENGLLVMTTNVTNVTAAPSVLPLSSRDALLLSPRLFSRDDFLSGRVSRRDRLIRVQSGLCREGHVDRIAEEKDACIIAVVGSGMKRTRE